MIITNEIKELVSTIETTQANSDSAERDRYILELVRTLKDTTSTHDRLEYENEVHVGTFEKYPIDEEGYAVSFDPLVDETGFLETWRKYGIVVGKEIYSKKMCDLTVCGVYDLVTDISNGACKLNDPLTWNEIPKDDSGISLISRGFLEIYHHQLLADIRQAVRMYIHHALIWGRYDLWTSFDRLGIKLPHHEESKALPLHTDQNPLIHPGFTTIQGVLALTDCPLERGTFVGVPGSRYHFRDFLRLAPVRGEYVEIPETDPIHSELKAHSQPFPLRKGDLITWDSRTVHANSENISNDTRVVAYVAAGVSRENDPKLVNIRREAYRSGVGSNMRDALMHASKKSRYTNYYDLDKIRNEKEDLNLLGQLLYGVKNYSDILI